MSSTSSRTLHTDRWGSLLSCQKPAPCIFSSSRRRVFAPHLLLLLLYRLVEELLRLCTLYSVDRRQLSDSDIQKTRYSPAPYRSSMARPTDTRRRSRSRSSSRSRPLTRRRSRSPSASSQSSTSSVPSKSTQICGQMLSTIEKSAYFFLEILHLGRFSCWACMLHTILVCNQSSMSTLPSVPPL